MPSLFAFFSATVVEPSPALERFEIPTAPPPVALGLCYTEGSSALLKRRPLIKRRPIELERDLRGIKTTALIIQARHEGEGRRMEDTPPFRFGPWMWGSIGALPSREGLREATLDCLADSLKRNVSGRTEEELLFHLLLTRLADAGISPLDWSVAPEPVLQALREAIAHWEQLSEAPIDDLAIVLSNGQSLFALSLGRPLWMQPLTARVGERFERIPCIDGHPERPPSAWLFTSTPTPEGEGLCVQEGIFFDTELARQSLWLR
ncbi:hypothetical protein KKF91_02890 [Myxococcota bacterium]|nr:hypothetical protein [Myxococcota bacterium]MBU1429486.1 hypothetical protein [Myxococcota bacterium]MBU1898144.1 hypothetical protein [Myxococcota bacterium]